MAEIEIRLPKMGESVTEATITNWLKNVGDNVGVDEPLVEVATDKVDNELPSEAAGVLVKILFEKDQVAQVGDVIAILSTDGGTTTTANTTDSKPVEAFTKVEVAATINDTTSQNGHSEKLTKNSASGKFLSPLVRSIAEKEGISQGQLDTISGTGQEGRITKKDILFYIENKDSIVAVNQANASSTLQAPSLAPTIISAPANTPLVGGNFLSNIKEPIVLPNPGDE
ncbi:MAG: 2-oxo acid dehydrogenase subunit E2, partial [Crocinitomicaceae bacterium]|nr:2-oxo acid dehydrogenase subunit E2 [Crocinitomicaceae bacterium]